MAINLSGIVSGGGLGPFGGFVGGALLGGLFGRRKKPKPNPGMQALNAWMEQMIPLAQSDLDFMKSTAPMRQQALRGLAQRLEPGAAASDIASFRRSTLDQALEASRQASWALGQGRNPGIREALALDAWNRASSAGNAFAADRHSPESLAASYAALAQALSPQALSGSFGMATDLIAGLQGLTPPRRGGGSFLDSLLPVVGQLAPYLDWRKIKL